MPDDANPQGGTTVELPVDAAVQLHNALGGGGTPNPQPGSSSVSVQLDADTAAKVKAALKTGLTGAVAIAWGEEENP
jgi:hypothetical protein